uniref:Uncharacterized protein n=1 Tax=Arundo donax TaxID=35708 RepID=A0A0A9A7B0_ARUDO
MPRRQRCTAARRSSEASTRGSGARPAVAACLPAAESNRRLQLFSSASDALGSRPSAALAASPPPARIPHPRMPS